MKVVIGSDFHLEFGRGELLVPEADVFLHAGDLLVVNRGDSKLNYWQKLTKRYRKFFQDCQESCGSTVIIMGNHESYGGRLHDTYQCIQDIIYAFPSITLLENEIKQYDSLAVFGARFWTDLNYSDPLVCGTVKSNMRDYELITTGDVSSYSRVVALKPADTVKENEYSRAKIREFLSMDHDDRKTLVMTHHAPTWASIPPKYRLDILSYGYANMGLDDMILDNDGPDFWIHGHIHTPCNYMHGDKTRIICNPRGYYSEETQAKTWEPTILHL